MKDLYQEHLYSNAPKRDCGNYRKYFECSEVDVFISFAKKFYTAKEGGACSLDIGVGTGKNVDYISKRIGGDLYGVDYSIAGLMHATQHCSGLLVNADARSLPFRSGVFDVTFCIGLFELKGAFDEFFSEVCRVTNQNGVIIFSVWNSSAPLSATIVNKRMSGSVGYSFSQIETKLDKIGVEVLSYTTIFHMPRTLFRAGYKLFNMIGLEVLYIKMSTLFNSFVQIYFQKNTMGNEWIFAVRKKV